MGTDFWAMIATALGGREFAIVVTGLVVLGGLGVLVALHLDGTRRVRAPLERLRRELAAIDADGSPSERLDAAGRSFESSPLADTWRAYRSTIEVEADGHARNYGDPLAFFAPDGPLASRLPGRRAGLAEAVLAVSLFGTLLAVIGAALTPNGGGVGGPVNLLPAFAGLLVYAIMVLAARMDAAGDRQAAIGIATALQRLSTHVPAETVLRRQLRAAELHEDQLQRFRGDLSTAIGSQIDAVLVARTERLPELIGSRIGESVGERLAPITTEMAETRAALARTGTEMAARAGDAFLQIWRSSAEAQLTSMTAALATSTAAVERQVAALSDAENRFVDSLDRSATRLTDAADRFETVLDGGAESITSRLKPLEGMLGSLPASIAASTDGALETIATGLGRTVESLHEATRGFGATATAELDGRIRALSSLLQGAAGEIAGAAAAAGEDLRKSGSALTASAADSVRQIAEAAAATGNTFGEQSRAMSTGLERAVAALASVTEAIAAGERNFGSGLERATGQLMESASTFRKNFEASNQSMAARLQELDTVLARGPDTISRTAVSAVDTITAAIEASARSIHSATDGYAEQATRTLSERIESFAASLEAATAHLTDSATTFRQSFEASNQSMAARLQELDTVLARGPDTISRTAVSAVDTITAAIEATARAIQTTTDGYAENATKVLDQRVRVLAETLDRAGTSLLKSSSDAGHEITQAVGEFGAQVDRLSSRLEIASADLARQPDRMSDAFGTVWKNAAAIQLESLTTSLRGSIDAMDAVTKTVQEVDRNLGSGLGKAAAKLDEASQRLDSLMIHRNATIADQLDALDQVLARLPAAIAETTEGAMKDIRTGLSGTVSELQKASTAFTSVATAEIEAKVRALAELLRKAGDEILAAARDSGETLRKSGDTLTEGITGGVKVIADTAQTASAHLSDAVGQLEGQIDKLATRLDHAAGGLAHQTGEMARAGEAISTTSAALSRMATAVEAAADPLTASVHSARDALTYVARGLATITAATEQGKNATDAITRSTDAARQFFDAQNTRITELDRVITSTLVQLRDSMKRLSTEISTEIRIIGNINREEVQGFLQEMDQKLRYLDKGGR